METHIHFYVNSTIPSSYVRNKRKYQIALCIVSLEEKTEIDLFRLYRRGLFLLFFDVVLAKNQYTL